MNNLRVASISLAIVCESCAALGAVPPGSCPGQTESGLAPTQREQLCITEGQIQALPSGTLRIEDPKVRAVLRHLTEQQASLRFNFGGPTSQRTPLRSGAARQQFGLKLHAANGCNVLYAEWRVYPESSVVVQLKRNPGMTKFADCGNEGYQTIRPSYSAPVPVLAIGAEHVMAVSLSNRMLVVTVDEKPVWQGEVKSELLDFSGPVGLRTDNVKLDFELFTASPGPEFSCQASE
jgi:hypothetical protein